MWSSCSGISGSAARQSASYSAGPTFAEEQDRRKDQFLATLSHELRNPLAPIRNAAAVLRRAHPGSEEMNLGLKTVIDRQAAHLSRLVDDSFDVPG